MAAICPPKDYGILHIAVETKRHRTGISAPEINCGSVCLFILSDA